MTRSNLIFTLLIIYFVGSLTAMAPMNLTFFLLFFGCIFVRLSQKTTLVLDSELKRYRFWALALLVTCWGSLVIAKLDPFSYADHPPEVTLHGFVKIWYLIIPYTLWVAYRQAESTLQHSLKTLLRPWWIATVVLCGIAWIQFFTGWPQPQPIPTNPGRFHAILFFGHHLSTASIIIFPAFTALAIASGFLSRNRNIKSIDPWVIAGGLSGVLILFLSYARTAWLALLLGFFLLLKKYVFPRLSRKQGFGIVSVLALAIALFSQLPLVKDRIEKLYGVSERTELWKANFDFFLHRPLTGIGWLKTQEMSEFYFKSIDPEHYRSRFWGHAHSNIFEMLGGTGLFGLIAFLGWAWFTLSLAYRVSVGFEKQARQMNRDPDERSDLAWGIFIGLVLLHFNGLTNVTFWEGKVMHQQMIAVGILLILNHQLKTEKV